MIIGELKLHYPDLSQILRTKGMHFHPYYSLDRTKRQPVYYVEQLDAAIGTILRYSSPEIETTKNKQCIYNTQAYFRVYPKHKL